MKKKRFYDNKRRGEKWTEPEVGRSIDFADKYVEPRTVSSAAYDRRARQKKAFAENKLTAKQFFKRCAMVLGCLLLVAAGYLIMDVYMERNAMPAESGEEDAGGVISTVKLDVLSRQIDSLSLDGAVMLDAVIDDVERGGYSAVAFDLKRADGTIGYNSSLATIVSAGAVSSPASDLKASVDKLMQNDLLAVGRMTCYPDNVLTDGSPSLAIQAEGAVYKNDAGSAYLNPDREEVYQYIKNIVEEAAGLGVSVFILDGTELPEEISGQYQDGFDVLVNRLTADLGQDIRYLKPISVSLSAKETKSIEKEVIEKMSRQPGKNEIYSVTCTESNRQAVKQILDEGGYTCYVLAE